MDLARGQQRSWGGKVVRAADRRMNRGDPTFDLGGREHRQQAAAESTSGVDLHDTGPGMGAANKCSIVDAGNSEIV